MNEHEYNTDAGNQRDTETYETALAEYGIDVTACDTTEKQTIIRQQAFLSAYADIGVITGASNAVGVSRMTVFRWQKGDVFAFRRRFEASRSQFCDSLETLALERVRAQKPNDSPLLLITLLNANLPSKYRATNPVIVDDRPQKVLEELKSHRSRSTRWGVAEGEKADEGEQVL